MHWLNIKLNFKNYFGYYLVICVIWFASFHDKFTSIFSPLTFTGWDTHAGFINFLYFRDSLWSGVIPLWNPFIQAGVTFLNINNVAFFSPLSLFFTFLSFFINPIQAYELLIQCVILIGGFGAFFLFRYQNINRFVAFFGGALFSIIILSPVVGQLGYITSYSSFPWLILTCSYLCDKKNIPASRWLFWGIAYTFYVSTGYLWLILIMLLISLVFSFFKIYNRQSNANNWKIYKFNWLSEPAILFLLSIGILYGCLMLPGFLNIYFNYGDLLGDFISPDGRLRGLNVKGGNGLGGALEILIGHVDPLISRNQTWWQEISGNYGSGWTLWILFILSLGSKWNKRQFFWLLLLIMGIIYSGGSNTLLGELIMRIPLLNANRYWGGVGTSIASISLLFLVIEKIDWLTKEGFQRCIYNIRLLIIFLGICIFLHHISASTWLYFLVGINCFFIAIFYANFLNYIGKSALLGLIALNIITNTFSPYRAYSNPPLDQIKLNEFILRNQKVFSKTNFRQLDPGREYNYYNNQWAINKVPFAHGYNHLGSPQYWYLKNNPLLEKIVVVTQNARASKDIFRSSTKNDNEYLELRAADVLTNPNVPVVNKNNLILINNNSDFNYKISNFELSPNALNFDIETNQATHIFINSVYTPSWNLLINGKKYNDYRFNYIFEGFDLTTPGKYRVEYSYKPYLDIFLILAPYFALIIILLVKLAQYRRQK